MLANLFQVRLEEPVDVRIRPWYNPDLKTATFIIPGLIAIILTFTLIQWMAIAIVRKREPGGAGRAGRVADALHRADHRAGGGAVQEDGGVGSACARG
jgi:hypothetical protein